MLDYCIYLLYRAISLGLAVLPLRFLSTLGEMLGFVAWLFLPRYRRLAQANLTIVFGQEKSKAEIRQLSRRHFQRLGGNLLSTAKLGTMPLDQLAANVTLENEDVVHQFTRAKRPVVVVLSHLGSWELFAHLFPRYFDYVRRGTVYQALRNRFIDADMQRHRARAGVELFDRRNGFQKVIALLRSGGVIGLLADQHAGDHGIWTPFFGRIASTSPLPALLAKRTGAAVVAAGIFTAGPGKWRMVFTPAIDRAGDSVESLTARVNDVIAEQIRHAPEDWFWVHNRWKTPRPNFLLTPYKRGIYLPPARPASQMKPFRILIRSTNWLGDSVISAAAVRAIKRGRPDARLTILAPAKIAAIWKLVPEVDEILELPASSLFAVARLLRKQEPFDAAILFPNSLRSALEIWLGGVPRRVGYRGHHRSWFLNQIVPDRAKRGPIEHQVHHYLHLAEQIGADVTTTPESGNIRNGSDGIMKFGLCVGAEYGPAKRWLPDRFAEVAVAVAAQHPVQWILFGTASDAEVGKSIAEKVGESCVNRIGQTTIDELISELGACRLLLTNDTGTMHLATLLQVPVVAVFGSTEPRLTGPLGSGNIVVRHHVECSPCFLRECPIDFRCMDAVTSGEVTAAVLSKLNASSAKPDNSVASTAHSV